MKQERHDGGRRALPKRMRAPLVRALSSWSPTKKKRAVEAKSRRPRFKALEDRRMLSISPLAVIAGVDERFDSTDSAPEAAVAADTTNTNQINRPGLLKYDLTGEGFVVGVWEAGNYVEDDHAEFEYRVTHKDCIICSESEHATLVAGIIGASGKDKRARGMAPDVEIWSFDSGDDLAELATYSAQGPGNPNPDSDQPIVVSNHSYGAGSVGWEKRDVGDFFGLFDSRSGYIDVWYDYLDQDPNGRVYDGTDPDFGRYTSKASGLDKTLADNPYLLSV